MFYFILIMLMVFDFALVFTTYQIIRDQYFKEFDSDMHIWPTVLYYIVYAYAVSILVVQPTLLSGGDLWMAFKLGFLMGLAVRGSYHIAIKSTFRRLPLWLCLLGWIVESISVAIISGLAVYLS